MQRLANLYFLTVTWAMLMAVYAGLVWLTLPLSLWAVAAVTLAYWGAWGLLWLATRPKPMLVIRPRPVLMLMTPAE